LGSAILPSPWLARGRVVLVVVIVDFDFVAGC
jgi:hypothetical protein